MADNDLKIRIGADLSQLATQFTGGINVLQRFGKAVETSLGGAAKSFTSFATSGSKIAESFDKLPTGDSAISRLKGSLDSAAQSATQSAKIFNDFGASVSASIARVSANTDGILQVTAAMNEAGAAAIKAGGSFLGIGVKSPIQDIKTLQQNVLQLKTDLASGFKPILNLVDPSTPKLLNSVSAALTNISPAANLVSASLKGSAANIRTFGNDVNKTLSDSVKHFDAFKTEALQLGDAFDKIPASLKPINTSGIASLRGAVKGLKVDLLDLKFKNLETQFNNINKSAAATGVALKAGIALGANSAALALQNVGRVAQDLPFGFIGIQNNLNPLLESFSRLKAESGSSGKALKALAGSLLGVGGLGLALSVVSAGILIYQNGIAGFNKKTKEAKEESDAYAESLKAIVGNLAKEATRVSILVEALKGESLTRKERTAAIEELQRINPTYFNGLKDEKGLIDDLAFAYKGYIQSLKKKFEVKVLEAQLDKLFNKKFTIEVDLDPKLAISKNKQLSDQILFNQTRLRREIEALGGPIDLGSITDITKITDQQKKVIALQERLAATGDIKLFDLTDNAAQLKSVNSQIDTLLDKITKMGQIDLDLSTGKGGTVKKEDAELNALKETLQGYRKELVKVNELRKDGVLPKFKEDDALKLQEDIHDILNKIDAREVKLKLRPKLEIDPTTTELELKQATKEMSDNIKLAPIDFPLELNPITQQNSYNAKLHDVFASAENIAKRTFSALTGIIIPVNLTLSVKSNVTEAFKGLKISSNFTKPMTDAMIAGIVALEPLAERYVGILQKFGENASVAVAEAVDALKNVPQILGSGIADSIAGIGEGIGAALTSGGNPIISAAESFLGIIGGVLQQVGKQIIIASKLVVALKAALNKAFSNPAASLVAGIALVIAGAALKNIKFNVPKFAEGGIVNKATLGIFGEAGREAIIPLDRLNEFMGDGGSAIDVHVVGKISGNDMVLLHDKTVKRNSRGAF